MIYNLQYVDKILIMVDSSINNFCLIKAILKWFEVDWEPLITLVYNRFRSWRNKFVSVGGRVILLNSVLNVILIFFLSFLKMQINVWNKLVMIQTNLLWEGVKLASNISWVYLSDICKPK